MAALFFYPLVAAADSQIVLLDWEPQHTAELFAAFALLAVAASALLRVANRSASRVWQIVIPVLALVPLASFGLAMLRRFPFKETIAPLAAYPAVRVALGLAAAAALGSVVVWAGSARRLTRLVLLALSPVTVVVFLAMGRLAAWEREPFRGAEPGAVRQAGRSNILVLLFDELSYAELYDGHAIRSAYPALRRFGETAVHYHAASAPGSESLVSIPGYSERQALRRHRRRG